MATMFEDQCDTLISMWIDGEREQLIETLRAMFQAERARHIGILRDQMRSFDKMNNGHEEQSFINLCLERF